MNQVDMSLADALVWLELTRQGLPEGWQIEMNADARGCNIWLRPWYAEEIIRGNTKHEVRLNPLCLYLVEDGVFNNLNTREAICLLRSRLEEVGWDEILARTNWCIANRRRYFRIQTYVRDTQKIEKL